MEIGGVNWDGVGGCNGVEGSETGLGPGFVELETTDREVVVVVCWMRCSLEDKNLKELESMAAKMEARLVELRSACSSVAGGGDGVESWRRRR